MTAASKNPHNNLNEVQKKAATHKGGPLLIAAGAGSGNHRHHFHQ
jgi:superfamily I DNA/RNA helicase